METFRLVRIVASFGILVSAMRYYFVPFPVQSQRERIFSEILHPVKFSVNKKTSENWSSRFVELIPSCSVIVRNIQLEDFDVDCNLSATNRNYPMELYDADSFISSHTLLTNTDTFASTAQY